MKKTDYLPEGYNTITPYLIVNNAAKAIDFYTKVLGGVEIMRMESAGKKIGHAEIKFDESKIMLADEYPEMDALSPQAYGGTPVMLHLYVEDVDSVTKKAVAAGAKLLRPVETMFYGDRSGTIEDPFGHKWSIATHVEDVPIDELKKRATEMIEGSKG